MLVLCPRVFVYYNDWLLQKILHLVWFEEGVTHIVSNGRWLFWHDNWLGEPLFKSLGASASSFPRDKVSDYLHDGYWDIPLVLRTSHPSLAKEIMNLPLPICSDLC